MAVVDPNIILGLDLGDRRIGVAVGNLISKTATPLADLNNGRQLAEQLAQLQTEYNFSKIIIGLPLTATGQHGEQARKVTELVSQLRQALDIEIILEDERFTTQSANKYLSANPEEGASLDGASAKLILESWLAHN